MAKNYACCYYCVLIIIILATVSAASDDLKERQNCQYEGEWHKDGTTVTVREPCLHCTCSRGALQCRRRSCAPLPDPPPRRCHTVHRKNSCCPELHCPEGVSFLQHTAAGRMENEDLEESAFSPAVQGCVEDGAVFAAGSAMDSRVPCEQCFCLGGVRRCVKPRCLPPPPGCRARHAPGACCPTRYYCQHSSAAASTSPPGQKNYDCMVNGRWIMEGEQVSRGKEESSCTQCFCLRGSVHCQPLSCAPALMGCRPIIRPGQCCPHVYQCPHKELHAIPGKLNSSVTSILQYISDNSLASTKSEDRALHYSKSTKIFLETSSFSPQESNDNNTSVNSATELLSNSTKVKRKTNDLETTSHKPRNNTSTHTSKTKTNKLSSKLPSTRKYITTTVTDKNTEAAVSTEKATEQPEGTVKIIINGTINCTTELSSNSEPLNITKDDSSFVMLRPDVQARVPTVNIDRMDIDDQTFNPNDIITDRSVNAGFDENDVFTINVTSSLIANTTHSTKKPGSVISVHGPEKYNISKKKKEDYVYDYDEATLPPSLPNLKIIPFVAADAVVDGDEQIKEPSYPILEREDKYPVYYSKVENKASIFANRREDVYNPTQYPIFTSESLDSAQFPDLTHDSELPNSHYANSNKDLGSLHNYVPSTSASTHILDDSSEESHISRAPISSTKLAIDIPKVNLFSPPIETEGGFVPKAPGIGGEYYAVYPSTLGPAVPHLTTSMQLDIHKADCTSSDGRYVQDGGTITLACSVCTCAWGQMHCSPRPCLTPPGCHRRPALHSTEDLCCGELVCNQESKSSTPSVLSLSASTIDSNEHLPESTESSSLKTVPMQLMPEKNSIKSDQTATVMTAKDHVNNGDVEKNKTKVTNLTNDGNKTSLELDKNVTEPDKEIHVLNTTQKAIIEMATTPKVEVHFWNYTNTSTLHNSSQEYEDEQEGEEEEDEDEGFSFGSVLKLLLSETYDTTTPPPVKRKPTNIIRNTEPSSTIRPTTTYPKISTTTPRPTSVTRKPSMRPTVIPFVPLPNIYPPSKKIPSKNVNAIDHLILGELTSIRKPTSRPFTTPSRPLIIASRRPFTTSTRPPELHQQEEDNFVGSNKYKPVVQELPRPTASMSSGIGAGLLKLAGCNIYGKMYNVGKFIAELSSPCLECRCMETGVQCRAAKC